MIPVTIHFLAANKNIKDKSKSVSKSMSKRKTFSIIQ